MWISRAGGWDCGDPKLEWVYRVETFEGHFGTGDEEKEKPVVAGRSAWLGFARNCRWICGKSVTVHTFLELFKEEAKPRKVCVMREVAANQKMSLGPGQLQRQSID